MLTIQPNHRFRPGRFALLAGLLVVSASLASGCAARPAELERLKQDNARLLAERDEARREVERLRATAATPAASTAPTSPATPTAGAATFTDIEDSAAREEILDLAPLGVFEGASGAFEPARPIRRAEFVRWLVRANNAMRKEKEIHLAEGGTATFTDVPASHPDFRYIQGMANAGIVIGYDATTFKPDKELCREELIAIKCGLDQGGLKRKGGTHDDIERLWHWTDARKVYRPYIDAFYSEAFNKAKNIDRTFGAIKMFRPQQTVTRGEAAICIWRIGDGLQSLTAAEALKTSTP